MKNLDYDKLMKIKTGGRDDTRADQYNYPYEPTPYPVLERLIKSGLIDKGDVLLDYGCGKGRVDFFVAYHTKASCIGVEYDERMFSAALENQKAGAGAGRTRFFLWNAEAYPVPKEVSCCYFFNPFSVEILRGVMGRIVESYYEYPREITLFFYYPSDEYMAYLMTVAELEFWDELDCRDLFDGESTRERIVVFKFQI